MENASNRNMNYMKNSLKTNKNLHRNLSENFLKIGKIFQKCIDRGLILLYYIDIMGFVLNQYDILEVYMPDI